MFEIMAPFYNWFMKRVNMDYSHRMAEWLTPLYDTDLLDLAGGTGINAQALADAGARVTILDSTRAMLAQAKKNGVKARLLHGSGADMPFADNSFDIVLVSDAWHHFREQDRIARETERVLRPGGRLYIIDFDRSKAKTWYLVVLEKMAGEPSTFLTPRQLAAMFESRGIIGDFDYITSNQYIYQGIKNMD